MSVRVFGRDQAEIVWRVSPTAVLLLNYMMDGCLNQNCGGSKCIVIGQPGCIESSLALSRSASAHPVDFACWDFLLPASQGVR